MFDTYASVEEIAHLFGWSVKYVRRLASTEGWRSHGYAPRRYSLEDVGRHRIEHPTRRVAG